MKKSSLLCLVFISLFTVSCVHKSLKDESLKIGDVVRLRADSSKVMILDTLTLKTDSTKEFNYVVKFVVNDTMSNLYNVTTTVKETEIFK